MTKLPLLRKIPSAAGDDEAERRVTHDEWHADNGAEDVGDGIAAVAGCGSRSIRHLVDTQRAGGNDKVKR
jgi:hypothetical protein